MSKNIKQKKEIFWPITRRGYCSEVLLMALIINYCNENQCRPVFIINSKTFLNKDILGRYLKLSDTVYKPSIFSTDIMGIKYLSRCLQTLLFRFFLLKPTPYQLFQTVWKQELYEGKINQYKISLISSILSNLLIFDSTVFEEFDGFVNRYNLSDGYIAFHVRRGDKLHSESSLFEVKEYVSRISNEFKGLPIVVLTDDYRVVEEFKAFLSPVSNCLICTTCKEVNAGYDNTTYAFSSEDSRHKEINSMTLDLLLSRNAIFFVGTYASNVSRVAYLLRKGKNCDSVDGNFKLVW